MSCGSLSFVFIILNLTVLCLSKTPSDCSCIRFNWTEVQFPSFSPEDEKDWKNAVCCITKFCLRKTNSSLLQNKTRCKQEPPINVTFPFISKNPLPNITFKRLPLPVLAMNNVSSSTARYVFNALGKIWKLLAFCLMAAALSGIIIWFLDHKANSGHFPKSFWSGIREGLWWAIVTMTTTGYGDKTPKSSLARAYASLWMIIGLLLMSITTAQISSTITTDDLEPLDDTFGKNVGIPLGSKDFFRKYCLQAKDLKEYSTQTELLQSLKNEIVDKVWLFGCKQNIDLNSILIVKSLGDPDLMYVNLGVKMEMLPEENQDNQDTVNFTSCMRQHLKSRWSTSREGRSCGTQCSSRCSSDNNHHTWKKTGEECLETMQKNIERYDKNYNKNRMDVGNKDCFENHSLGKNRRSIKSDTGKEMEFVDYFLCGLAGLLLVLLIVGALWEIFLRARNGNKLAVSNVDVEKGTVSSRHEMKTMNELQFNDIIVN